jgi:signal transduction histidine kinase
VTRREGVISADAMRQRSGSAWQRWSEALGLWVPYIGIALSTVQMFTQASQSIEARLGSLGLLAIAGVWVYLMYTRAPEPRTAHRTRMLIYFAGLSVLSALLLTRHPSFWVFAVTGVFHANALRPWPLMLLGVGVTSTIINTITTGFPWPSVEVGAIFVTLIVIQTLAIGGGTIMTEKLTGISEERRQSVAKLEAALAENAGLHAQLVTQAREAGVLDERQRLAREIHDTIAQGLTGIVTQLEAADQQAGHPEDVRRHIDNAVRLARESLAEARRSVDGSRPGVLDREPLARAMASVARDWSALSGVPVEVTTTGAELPLHPEIELALLRIAQEALTNVGKHAGATRAGVTLSYMGDVVTLDVRDDGVGFPAGAEPSAGFGLTSMRQRAQRVAGTLEIESEPGAGTAVSARVPAIAAVIP